MSESAPKRLLGVDLGDRRTGVAVTDAGGELLLPLPAIEARDDATRVARLATLCEERDTEVVVVGLPLSTDGSEGPRARRTRSFVGRLRKALSIPVELMDERDTTSVAHERLAESGMKAARRKRIADSVAAQIILERYQNRS